MKTGRCHFYSPSPAHNLNQQHTVLFVGSTDAVCWNPVDTRQKNLQQNRALIVGCSCDDSSFPPALASELGNLPPYRRDVPTDFIPEVTPEPMVSLTVMVTPNRLQRTTLQESSNTLLSETGVLNYCLNCKSAFGGSVRATEFHVLIGALGPAGNRTQMVDLGAHKTTQTEGAYKP